MEIFCGLPNNDEYVEGEISRSVYTNISKLVLDLIWTFYAE